MRTKLMTEERRALEVRHPDVLLRGDVALRAWDAPRKHDHKGQRQVRHGLGIAPRRDDDRDAPRGRRLHVHVDRAAARAADKAQAGRRIQDRVGHGRAVHHQDFLVR